MLFRRSSQRPAEGGQADGPKGVVDSLFGDWYAPLLRYACRATGRMEVAEDLVQEAFMELYRALIGGKTVENPKAWTLCVVRRSIIDQQREQARRGGATLSLSTLGEVAEPRAPESPAAWEEDDFSRLLAVLSTREEEVLLLRAKGLKYRQIAAALKISTNSVKTLLARGIRKMQRASGGSTGASGIGYDGDFPSKTLQ